MASGDSLDAIEPFIGEIMEKLEPRARKRLVDKMMRKLRRANAQRISANREPGGNAMAPRKKRRQPKKGKMFRRIGKASSLRIRTTPDSGELSFANPLIDNTAATHHFGLEGYVGRTRQGKVIRTKYQARELIGFGTERDELVDEVLAHISN